MTFSRRALSLSGVSMVLAGAVLVACSDGSNLVAPAPEIPTAPDTSRFSLQCEVDLRSRTLGCGQPGAGGASRTLILGGQNVNVTLAASNFSTVDVPDPSTLDTLAMDVTVQNLIGQALGVNTDGTPDVVNGVRVFFFSGPTAVPSGIAEAADIDGTDLFLASTQPFYRYPQVLQPTQTSAARRWKLAHTQGATSVRFTVYVAAEIRFPNGWVDVNPAADTLANGETSALSGTARDRLGRVAGISQTLIWSSGNPAVATVDASTGVVTAAGQGTAIITATNGTQVGTATVVVNNAPMAVADTVDALGNITVPVDSAQGLLANDTDANGDGLQVMPGTFATARGGSVTFNADGSLEYRGPAGLELAYDSVQYTVTDGVQSASAWLHINVGQRVWFVQPGASLPGDGRQSAPFDALVGVDSIASADETVYVLAGGATAVADAGITLKAGQSLVGQALAAPVQTTLNERPVVLLTPGAAPLVRRTTMGAAVRLGTNNSLSGLTVGSTAGSAISGANFGTLTVDAVSITAAGGPALDLETGTLNVALASVFVESGTQGVRLVETAGTLTASSGSIAATFTVQGGSVSVTYPGSLSEIDAAVLSVSGGHTGTLTFSGGVVTMGGTGIRFDDADGVYRFPGTTALAGGDAALSIVGSDGRFVFGAQSSITNPSLSPALNVSGGAPTVLFGGNISANAGRAVAVQGITGDTVEVSGSITSTGQGIHVADNSAGTIHFTGPAKTLTTAANPAVTLTNNGSASILFAGGGLAINTSTGAGFSATGGGNIEVTGVGNTVATSTGVPVTINGTSIAGSGVTFAQVSANGAPAGIVLNNTGPTNGLLVTGDGSSAAGSGGVIQNTTGPAIQLTNTLQTELRYLTVSGAGGVTGANFGALTVNNVAITSAGAPALALTTGSVTGTFSSITASGAANGVSLNAVGGFFAANGGTLTGGAGAAFQVVGGDVGVVWNGSLQQANAAPLVSVGGGHNIGTITFQTGTLAASNGSGLRFDNADGTYAFSGPTTLNGGTAGVDILNGSAGAFTFGTGTGINSTAAGDTAFHVSASTPGVVYSGGISKSSAGPLVQMTGVTGGSAVFNTGTLSATAGTGLQFSNADGTVAFNGTVALNGGDAGIDILAGSDGGFTFGTGVSVTNPTGIAFDVGSGASNVGYAGSVRQDFAVALLNVAGGHTGTLNFQTGTVNANGGTGLQFTDADGTYNFTGSLDLSGGDAGIDIGSLSTGTVNVSPAGGNSALILSPTGAAIASAGGAGDLTFNGNVTQSGNAALLSVAGAHSGDVSFPTGTLTATNGSGLQFNDADGTYAFNGTTTLSNGVAGADAGIDVLNGSAGTFSFNANATVTNPANQLVTIQNSAPTFTYSGSLTKNNNAVTGILAQNNTGGSVTFNGDRTTETKVFSTGTAAAVNLASNGTMSFLFSGGGLSIGSTTGNGFSATGGGTLQVTGALNTIASAGGVALNVQNTSIGAGGLSFQSISSNGASHGIRLENTGNANGLQVTGDGATPGSGGSILNPANDGVRLANVINVSLNYVNIDGGSGTAGGSCGTLSASDCSSGVDMVSATAVTINRSVISNSAQMGISGQDVNGLTVTKTRVMSAGDGNDEFGMVFHNLTGTALIEDVRIQGAEDSGMWLRNTAGTLNLTMNRDTITENGINAALNVGEHGAIFEIDGSAVARVLVQNSEFFNLDRGAILAQAEGTGAGSTLHLTVQNNSLRDIGSFGVEAVANYSSTLNVNVANNTIHNWVSNGVNILGAVNSTVNARVVGNTLTNPRLDDVANGIRVVQEEDSDMTTLVQGNSVSGQSFTGIIGFSRLGDLNSSAGTGAAYGTHHLTVRGNNVGAPTATNGGYGIDIQAQNEENELCLDIGYSGFNGANVSAGTGAGVTGIRVRKSNTTSGTGTNVVAFRVEGLAGGAQSIANTVNHVQSFNAPTTAFGGTTPSGGTFEGVAVNSCRDAAAVTLP